MKLSLQIDLEGKPAEVRNRLTQQFKAAGPDAWPVLATLRDHLAPALAKAGKDEVAVLKLKGRIEIALELSAPAAETPAATAATTK